MYNKKKSINENLCRIMAENPDYNIEMNIIAKLYEFYDGVPEDIDELLNSENDYGQLWRVRTDDYTPTREVRNITKKLIDKQSRFFLSVPPSLNFKAIAGEQSEQAENKRNFIDTILEDNNFWAKSKRAFTDSVIAKRVLLAVLCDVTQSVDNDTSKGTNQGEIILKYFTAPEFIYQFKPHSVEELQKVVIAYADENTVGLLDKDQKWFRWTYEMKRIADTETCIATYEELDGTGVHFVDVENGGRKVIISWDTKLDHIPCKLILNDAGTRDVRGRSDLLDLVSMANDYNRTVSDYRDALKFKMFEQPVFINADDSSLAGVKISPGSVISLKPDMSYAGTDGTPLPASAQMLSSTFNFADATNSYLDGLKKDMYEIMEQPLPEQIHDVPSGKALGMLYNDLISRCEDKWVAWDEAIKWMVDLIIFMVEEFGLYTEDSNRAFISTDTLLTIKHNYPIPDNELEEKQVAIQEVHAGVKSKVTYIKEYGIVEDALEEYEQIMEEGDRANESMNKGLMDTNLGFEDEDGGEGDEGDESGKSKAPNADEDDDTKKGKNTKKGAK